MGADPVYAGAGNVWVMQDKEGTACVTAVPLTVLEYALHKFVVMVPVKIPVVAEYVNDRELYDADPEACNARNGRKQAQEHYTYCLWLNQRIQEHCVSDKHDTLSHAPYKQSRCHTPWR